MLKSIRARVPLWRQAAVAACCVACADFYTRAHRHPVGVPYDLLRLAPYASLLLLVWLVFEVRRRQAPRWKRFSVLAAGLLFLLITYVATGKELYPVTGHAGGVPHNDGGRAPAGGGQPLAVG